MPTKNPRLTITLEPTVHAQLRRLSELTGNSQSSMISELLEGSEAIFSRLIQVLEAANDAKQEMRGRITSDLAGAQTKMEGQLGLALEVFEGATGDLLREAEAVKRRARRGAKAARSPVPAKRGSTPMSNRGVRSGRKTSTSPVKRGEK